MKVEKVIIMIGSIMFSVGIVMFYSIELGQTDSTLRLIKNIGTFMGLAGIGVILAGLLLYLINKNEPPVKENLDV